MDKRSAIDFYRIYDEHYETVRMLVMKTIKYGWVADDLTQETFVRAFRNIGTLKDNDKIRPWLLQIARNLCRDHFRFAHCKIQGDRKLENRNDHPRINEIEKSVRKKQMSQCVQKQMERLPESQRNALWLFEVMGLSTAEIAESLKISIENVRVSLHRARRNFKAILNEKCSFEQDELGVLVCEPKTGGEVEKKAGPFPDLPGKSKNAVIRTRRSG